VLTHPGKVSHEVAEKLALEQYTKFDDQRREGERIEADREDMKALEDVERKLEKKKKRKNQAGEQ